MWGADFCCGLGCRVPGAGCPGAGCRVPGAGCRVPGCPGEREPNRPNRPNRAQISPIGLIDLIDQIDLVDLIALIALIDFRPKRAITKRPHVRPKRLCLGLISGIIYIYIVIQYVYTHVHAIILIPTRRNPFDALCTPPCPLKGRA